MNTIKCIDSYIDKEKNLYSCFLIEPLETGHGITLGNSLRRTLLSDLTSFSITGVRINNTKHEFENIEGVRDDILEILLNLKEILFKVSFPFEQKISQKLIGFLEVKGPVIVTAGMFFLPKNEITILNPKQYICTITTETPLYIEIEIENGYGYQLRDDKYEATKGETFQLKKPNTFFVDTLFLPVQKVNYKIKLITDTYGNIKESLTLEILTNGTISPQRSLKESLRILVTLFGSLLIDSNFSKISSSFYTKLIKIENLQKELLFSPITNEEIKKDSNKKENKKIDQKEKKKEKQEYTFINIQMSNNFYDLFSFYKKELENEEKEDFLKEKVFSIFSDKV